eukprot:scaffold181628_cov83-Attheya_sp.AAC.2
MIAQILWAIFGDARQFFGKCAKEKDLDSPEDMPLSHLQAVHSILASKMELRLMDLPQELLTKKPPAQAPKGAAVQQGGNPSGGRPTPQRVEHTPDNPANTVTYRYWPAKFKTLLEELSDEPFLNLRQVCTDSNVTIGDIKRPGKNNDGMQYHEVYARAPTGRVGPSLCGQCLHQNRCSNPEND